MIVQKHSKCPFVKSVQCEWQLLVSVKQKCEPYIIKTHKPNEKVKSDCHLILLVSTR